MKERKKKREKLHSTYISEQVQMIIVSTLAATIDKRKKKKKHHMNPTRENSTVVGWVGGGRGLVLAGPSQEVFQGFGTI